MIELSRRQQHMGVADDGLNADYTFENVKEGFEVTGLVCDVPVSVKVTSCPVTVQVSSLVRAHLLFSDVLATSDLTTFKSADDLIKKKYPLGKEVKLIYT